MDVKIYTPRSRQSIISLGRDIGEGLWEGRELALRLFLRDLKAGYRKSFLGIAWLFIPPLATAGVWIFLNSQRVVAIQKTPMNYAAFTLCGTMLWTLFAEAITKPILRYQGAMNMMSKLNFPREAVVLACIYDLSFSLLIKLIILIPGLWIFGYPPHWGFLPGILFIVILMLGGLTIGFFLSPFGLLYNDVGKGLPIILPFAMYLTPVIYPLRTGGALALLQGMNPATPFIERARSFMGDYQFELHHELGVWAAILMVILVFSLIAMRIALPIIVERAGGQ